MLDYILYKAIRIKTQGEYKAESQSSSDNEHSLAWVVLSVQTPAARHHLLQLPLLKKKE
jgi:hypothetical protein